MDNSISIEQRKYNLINQITNFQNEKVIEKLEDFFYLIRQQAKFDARFTEPTTDKEKYSKFMEVSE